MAGKEEILHHAFYGLLLQVDIAISLSLHAQTGGQGVLK